MRACVRACELRVGLTILRLPRERKRVLRECGLKSGRSLSRWISIRRIAALIEIYIYHIYILNHIYIYTYTYVVCASHNMQQIQTSTRGSRRVMNTASLCWTNRPDKQVLLSYLHRSIAIDRSITVNYARHSPSAFLRYFRRLQRMYCKISVSLVYVYLRIIEGWSP